MSSIDESATSNYIFTGGVGYGKSYILIHFKDYLELMNEEARNRGRELPYHIEGIRTHKRGLNVPQDITSVVEQESESEDDELIHGTKFIQALTFRTRDDGKRYRLIDTVGFGSAAMTKLEITRNMTFLLESTPQMKISQVFVVLGVTQCDRFDSVVQSCLRFVHDMFGETPVDVLNASVEEFVTVIWSRMDRPSQRPPALKKLLRYSNCVRDSELENFIVSEQWSLAKQQRRPEDYRKMQERLCADILAVLLERSPGVPVRGYEHLASLVTEKNCQLQARQQEEVRLEGVIKEREQSIARMKNDHSAQIAELNREFDDLRAKREVERSESNLRQIALEKIVEDLRSDLIRQQEQLRLSQQKETNLKDLEVKLRADVAQLTLDVRNKREEIETAGRSLQKIQKQLIAQRRNHRAELDQTKAEHARLQRQTKRLSTEVRQSALSVLRDIEKGITQARASATTAYKSSWGKSLAIPIVGNVAALFSGPNGVEPMKQALPKLTIQTNPPNVPDDEVQSVTLTVDANATKRVTKTIQFPTRDSFDE